MGKWWWSSLLLVILSGCAPEPASPPTAAQPVKTSTPQPGSAVSQTTLEPAASEPLMGPILRPAMPEPSARPEEQAATEVAGRP